MHEFTIKVKVQVNERTTRDRRDSKTRVYFSHSGESILDNLANRLSRPVDLYRAFLPAVAEELGLPPNTKFGWSQYAGCSCPCSPGFICDESRGKDVWVTLSEDAPAIGADPAVAELAEMRRQHIAQDPTMPWSPTDPDMNT